MREQLARLQAERRALREQATPAELTLQAAAGEPDLRQQLEQARAERQALEEKLAARDRQSEQKIAALETEIEQLMERLLRMRR